MQNRIKELRKKAGLSQEALGELIGLKKAGVGKLENGTMNLTANYIQKISDALQISPQQLLVEDQVPVIGVVGAGAKVFPVDDMPLIRSDKGIRDSKSQSSYRAYGEKPKPEDPVDWVESPPGIESIRGIVALRVEGDSMMPFMPAGTVVYYNQRFDGVQPECIGRLCVVELKDGCAMLKIVQKGSAQPLAGLAVSVYRPLK